MKRNFPHIFLIFLFCCLFILTQKLETNTLLLGLADTKSGDIYHNHKTLIQINIFVYTLSISLTIVSFLKVVKNGYPKLVIRILLNIISIKYYY